MAFILSLNKWPCWSGLWLILLLSLGLRVYHLNSKQWQDYVHDFYPHNERVDYTARHWANPAANTLWESSQQPLYYWIGTLVYDSRSIDASYQINLAAMGLCFSAGSLCLLFLSLLHLSSWLMRYFLLIYVGLTPSFIMASDSGGPDILLTFFGIYFFYCVMRLNRQPRKSFNFWISIVVLLLALFSKLNAIVLVFAVPFLLWRHARADSTWWPTVRRFFIISFFLLIWIGLTLWHARDPVTGAFVFSYGWMWDYLRIPETNLRYFCSFSLSDIIGVGQATADSPDVIRYSFLNYLYGNMVLGEPWYNFNFFLHMAARTLLTFETILPFGFLLMIHPALFGYPVTRQAGFNPLLKTAFVILAVGVVLAVYFVYQCPQICSNDFRFQYGALGWIGYAAGRGLCSFPRGKALRTLAIIFVSGYAVSSTLVTILNYAMR